MRRCLLTAAVLAIGTATGAPSAMATTCVAPHVVWRGVSYEQLGHAAGDAPDPPVAGRRERAVLDSPCPGDDDETVAVRRIRGIDARVAIAVGRDGAAVADGFFPALPSFPVAGLRTRPPAYRCARGRAVAFAGQAGDPSADGFEVELSDGAVALGPQAVRLGTARVTVGARTRFTGLRRLGLPYVAPGQRVRVRARLCFDLPQEAGAILADEVSADGPVVTAGPTSESPRLAIAALAVGVAALATAWRLRRRRV